MVFRFEQRSIVAIVLIIITIIITTSVFTVRHCC